MKVVPNWAEKCTECVGFFDQEACQAVCPVDCCVPDPDRPESEEILLERAKILHPETTFEDDFPSRFRQDASHVRGGGFLGERPFGAARGRWRIV